MLSFVLIFPGPLLTDSDYEETLASMQCGNKAKLVDNAVKKNEVFTNP